MENKKEDDQFVPLRQLARELRIDPSHLRRYAIRLGIRPSKRHTKDSGKKLVVTVTSQEAEEIREARREQGYDLNVTDIDLTIGVFYIVQLIPELDPSRVKLGFADNMESRLA